MGKRRINRGPSIHWIEALSGNQRFPSFKLALDIAHNRNFHYIVETGSYHEGYNVDGSQGKSTLIFGRYCKEHHTCNFESIDNDVRCTEIARQALENNKYPGFCITSDSISFLQSIQHPIDLLYLDSYDFEPDNPQPAQTHQMREVEAAYPRLSDNSLILLDDCDMTHGGKGYWSTIYLTKRDWKVIHDGYQRLFSRV